MSSISFTSTSAPELLKKTNDILENLKKLESNVSLFNQLQVLEQNLNKTKQDFDSFKDNIDTTKCNAQCKAINKEDEQNTVDVFLNSLQPTHFGSTPSYLELQEALKPVGYSKLKRYLILHNVDVGKMLTKDKLVDAAINHRDQIDFSPLVTEISNVFLQTPK